ncbi:hypothetical protein RDV89_08005 [Nocardioides zeae]|uniref:Protein kinase domain-containing protein n=1 Tax=Nocardioides imazamoxiresistens TaxID=3231893 RepID=A0ABU3PW02_9ACTN|nr:hypothetical protein [Nocardioides zeae]MDT9593007.1 hypothetical protein [Nocardioides zeae]
MDTAQALLRRVEDATTPADLYGPADGDPAGVRRARRTHRVLALHLHPDRPAAGLDSARAAAAFAKATALYAAWSRPTGGTGGGDTDDRGEVLVGSRGTHRLGPLLARGTVANVYAVPGTDTVVKLVRRPGSNRFVRNERAALRTLARYATGTEAWLAPYVPRLVDTATAAADEAGGEVLEANVLGSLGRADGFVSLAAVRDAAPDGLDGRDWAWMQRRLLRALAGAHAAGLVHGAVLPENVLIHPREHGVVLAGWSFATRPGRRAEGVVRSQAGAYPPEATDGLVTPATDVAMLGALALTMLRPGERAQRRFAQGCRQAEPRMRPTAAGLLEEYDDLLERLHGPRRFRPFDLAV